MDVQLGEKIRALATDYASVSGPALRASVRAQLLGMIDKLELAAAPLRVERVDMASFQNSAALRGAIRAHVDLAFRSPIDPGELMAVVTRGICRVAWHPALDVFPVGVALALPSRQIIRARGDLFADDSTTLGAPILVLFALATNPPRLGAAAALLEALSDDCAQLDPVPRLLAFTPLTGLRAELIALVDDDAGWQAQLEDRPDIDADQLRQQIRDALAVDALTGSLEEPLRSWLVDVASDYADSDSYTAGEFHRARGAELIGVCESADPGDPDAMWMRALFDFGQVQKKRRHRPKSAPPE